MSDSPHPPAPPGAVARSASIGSRGAKIALGTAAAIVAAVVVASFVNLNEYAITPGQARSVIPLISVAKGHASSHRGAVLLTDVELVPLRAVNYLFYALNGDDQLVPKSQVSGTLTTTQYDTEGVMDMALARQAATVVALRTLGYPTSAVATGVAEYAPDGPDVPVIGSLDVGDVITSIDGHATLSEDALLSVLSGLGIGARATITYHPFGSTKSSTVTVQLGSARGGSTGETCLRANERSTLRYVLENRRRIVCLGIVPEQLLATVKAPFGISMSVEGIIGPSAGLAFTLGLIAKLDRANLTGGATIAATGTMTIDGSVGDVGGVAEKTVAVRRAGATIFFVPPQELKVARAHAGSTLKVFAVNNVSQAIADLERLGGRVVRPDAR